MATRKHKRLVFRILRATLKWLLIALLLLVLGAYGLLQTQLGRDLVRDLALPLVNKAIPGEIAVGRITSLTLGHARLEDVVIYDVDGRPVIEARDVYAEPDLLAIIGGEIAFDRAEVSGYRVTLATGRDGYLNVETMFDMPSEGPDGPLDPNLEVQHVRIREAVVRDGTVRALWDEALGLEATDFSVAATLHVEIHHRDTIRVGIRHAEGFVSRTGERLFELQLSGQLYTGPEHETRVLAQLSGELGEAEVVADVMGLDGDEPVGLETSVVLDRVRTELLAELGLDLTDARDSLPAWLSGTLTTTGTDADLQIDADLVTAGGALALWAHLRDSEPIEARVETDRLVLSQIAPALPEMTIGASARVGVERSTDPDAIELSLRLERGAIDGRVLPPLEAEATIGGDAVAVRSLVVEEVAETLEASGTAGFDGTVEAELIVTGLALDELDSLQALLPGAGGRVDADLSLSLSPEPEASFEVSGAIALEQARWGDLSGRSLSVAGSVRGSLEGTEADQGLRLDAQIDALDVGTPDFRLASAHLRGSGNLSRLQVAGRARVDGGPTAELRLSGRLDGEEVTLDGSVDLEAGGERLEAALVRVRVNPSRVAFDRLGLRHELAELDLTGSYELDGRADLSVDIAELDLTVFDGRLGLPELDAAGQLDGRVRLRGTVARPEVSAALQLRGGAVETLSDANARVSLELGQSGFEIDADVSVADTLDVIVAGGAEFSRYRSVEDAFEHADYDLSLDFEIGDLSRLAELTSEVPSMSGGLRGSARWRGSLDDPDLSVELLGEHIRPPDSEWLDVEASASFQEQRLSGNLAFADELGPVGTAELWADLDWTQVTSGDLAVLGESASWEIRLEVPERQIGSHWIRNDLFEAVPMWAAVDATIGRPSGELPRGVARIELRSSPDDDRRSDEPCQYEEPIALSLQADFRDGVSTARAEAAAAGRPVLDASFSLPTALGEWLTHPDVPLFHNVSGDLSIDRLDLDAFPVVCREASGVVSAQGSLVDLASEAPSIELRAQGTGLSVHGTPPHDAEASVRLSRDELLAEASLDGDGGGARFEAALPLVWTDDGYVELRTGAWGTLRAEFDDFALRPLVAIVPPLERAEGRLNGAVALEGAVGAAQPAGELELSDVEIAIDGLGQRLSGINGRLRVTPDGLAIDGLVARDRDGRVEIDGTLFLDRIFPERIEATIVADEFPTRSEGNVRATVSMRADVEADISSEATVAEIRLTELDVRLPDEERSDFQELDRHPDVVYRHELQALDREPVDREPTTPIRLSLSAPDPFWLRRNDFAVQLTMALLVEVDADGVSIEGPVQVVRGSLDFMGKSFELTRGEVTFTGETEIDPLLDVRAEHRLLRYPGDRVTIVIGGRLSSPVVELRCTIPDVETDAQIVQLLLTGEAQQRTADREQAADVDVSSFVSGLTAGLLTMTARNQLGEGAPMISVRTGEDPRDLELSAGFVADRLIPEALSGFVNGMYVEGYVGSQTTGEGEQETSRRMGGFLIELYYNRGWLTRSKYEPPSNWFIDVLWQP